MNHQQYFNQYFMSNEDWALYGPITHKIFNYMNGKVNTVNYPAVLNLIQVNPAFDRLLGQHNFPNIVDIYLGNLLLQYDDLDLETKSYFEYKRHDFICSRIAYTICHELFHADQFLKLFYIQYTGCYYDKSELEVEESAFQWMHNHRTEIEQLIGFEYLEDSNNWYEQRQSWPFVYDYERTTLERIYVDRIDYAFNMERFEEFAESSKILSMHNLIASSTNCTIKFKLKGSEVEDVIQFKKDGQYIPELLSLLDDAMTRYITNYFDFNKDWEINYDKPSNSIEFVLEYYNYRIEPIIIRKDMAQAYDEWEGD